jgi:histidine kinase
MRGLVQRIRASLVSKLLLSVNLILFCALAVWAYSNIEYQKKKVMENIVEGAERLSTTIKLGTHYAMMLNSRDDINQIIQNIARQKGIQKIRIYNKAGQIKFSSRSFEVDWTTNIKAEACDICHRSEPPRDSLTLEERTRVFDSGEGYRLLGILGPIYNETGCATAECHVHPPGKKILGALDLALSLEKVDREILIYRNGIILLAVLVFLLTSALIFGFVLYFVNRPIKLLIEGTRRIEAGDHRLDLDVGQTDELGQLAKAVNHMGKAIGQQQAELSKRIEEYQNLFEVVPCLITVQDRDFRLIQFNREFAQRFDPKHGDFCYTAYKGRTTKCPDCPVEKTFADGQSHWSEESGIAKDGSPTHWIVRTTPIRDDAGRIVAAMEVNLDITQRKQLEERLQKSEHKYHAIFNNIPNPVFVLDAEHLDILDCNASVLLVYDYHPEEILCRSFLNFFKEEERDAYRHLIKTTGVINQARQSAKGGRSIFVNIRISPSEYWDQKVLLVTTSDITKRLQAEQQLIQASKMATLGEMATGVAHELNQPLTVIKTASSYFMRKVHRNESIDNQVLAEMAVQIDSHVDRAAKIINHMRQFGRKSDLVLSRVDVVEILKKAFELFSQQLKVRGIEVKWLAEEALPPVMADPGRLEQVFINLLLNARDAIEERSEKEALGPEDKAITLKAFGSATEVVVEVCDTGIGIPPAIADRLFEPFFTTKKVGQGTGLGLSISYGIVQECGATIRAVANENQGACFVVAFPLGQSQ